MTGPDWFFLGIMAAAAAAFGFYVRIRQDERRAMLRRRARLVAAHLLTRMENDVRFPRPEVLGAPAVRVCSHRMGYEVVPVTTPAEAREIVEVDDKGTEVAGRIRSTRCNRCAEPIGVNRPFRSLDGGLYRHIVCEPLEGA